VIVAVWDGVRAALLDLESSGALTQYPDPRSDQARQPPFVIHLAPWAADAASELERHFGDNMKLVVGSLLYPEYQPWRVSPKSDDITEEPQGQRWGQACIGCMGRGGFKSSLRASSFWLSQ
jgi:hypothetical protein